MPPSKYELPVPDTTFLQSQAGPSQAASSNSRYDNLIRDIKRPLQQQEGYDEEDYFDEEDPSEEGDDRYFNPALLSHIAVRLRDKVPRGTHVKGSIPYERAFTGKDIVVSATLSRIHSVLSNVHCSLPSSRKYNGISSLLMAFRLTTDGLLFK